MWDSSSSQRICIRAGWSLMKLSDSFFLQAQIRTACLVCRPLSFWYHVVPQMADDPSLEKLDCSSLIKNKQTKNSEECKKTLFFQLKRIHSQPLTGNSNLINKQKWLVKAHAYLLSTIILHWVTQHLTEVIFDCSEKGFFCNYIALCWDSALSS